MRPDPLTQERVYLALKADFFAGAFDLHARMDLTSIAERYVASKTPVREAVYRMVGEKLLSSHADGGFRIALPDRGRLAQLYAWNAQHLLSALRVCSREALTDRLLAVRDLFAIEARPPVTMVEETFKAIGEATGNAEFIAQIEAANGRLHYPRLGEAVVFRDLAREAEGMFKSNGYDVQTNMRRRVLNYHRRRFEHAQRIERTWTLGDAEYETA